MELSTYRGRPSGPSLPLEAERRSGAEGQADRGHRLRPQLKHENQWSGVAGLVEPGAAEWPVSGEGMTFRPLLQPLCLAAVVGVLRDVFVREVSAEHGSCPRAGA